MLRVERLRAREAPRVGMEAVAPGGWRHAETDKFLDWASHYDDGTQDGRTRAKHETWLAALPGRVLHVVGARPLAHLVGEVVAAVR